MTKPAFNLEPLALFELGEPLTSSTTTRQRWYRAVQNVRNAGVQVRLNVADCGCCKEPVHEFTEDVAHVWTERYFGERSPAWDPAGEPKEPDAVHFNHRGGAAPIVVEAFRAQGFHVVWDGSDFMSVIIDTVGVVTSDPADPAVIEREVRKYVGPKLAVLDEEGAPIYAVLEFDGENVEVRIRAYDVPGVEVRVSTRKAPIADDLAKYSGAQMRLMAMARCLEDEALRQSFNLVEELGRTASVDQLRVMRQRMAEKGSGFYGFEASLDDGIYSRFHTAA